MSDKNIMSIAVWVDLIALAGVAAVTSAVR